LSGDVIGLCAEILEEQRKTRNSFRKIFYMVRSKRAGANCKGFFSLTRRIESDD